MKVQFYLLTVFLGVVLTVHLAEDGPSKAAEQRVIAFFKERTGA